MAVNTLSVVAISRTLFTAEFGATTYNGNRLFARSSVWYIVDKIANNNTKNRFAGQFPSNERDQKEKHINTYVNT